MDLSVPTTFTRGLLETLAAIGESRFPSEHRVAEVYGSLTQATARPLPPSGLLANLDSARLARHAEEARRLGLRFRCLFGDLDREFLEREPEPRAALRSLLGLLTDAGVEAVAVTVPLLVEWIRQDAPHMEVDAWVGASSVREVQALAHMGCRGVSLDLDANRDFPRLEATVAQGGAAVRLLANPACLLSCTYRPHKREDDALGKASGFSCQLRCHIQKVIDPVEFVKTPWIRPEDLSVYSTAGVASVRLESRGLDEVRLARLVEIYLAGRFDGNLVELIDWGSWDRWSEHPEVGRLPPLDVHVDNRALDGFLSHFRDSAYRCHLGCRGCDHCPEAARVAVRFDPALAARWRRAMEAALARELGEGEGACSPGHGCPV